LSWDPLVKGVLPLRRGATSPSAATSIHARDVTLA
jgi:hypothetical protein